MTWIIEEIFEDVIINPIGILLFDRLNIHRLIETEIKNKKRQKITRSSYKLRKVKPKNKRLRSIRKEFFKPLHFFKN